MRMNDTVNLRCIKSGMLTLVQDMGRSGHRASGIPVGGSADKLSAICANWLVGNGASDPVLEIMVMGPAIEFNGTRCTIALTGADISPVLNDKPVAMNRSITVEPGDILKFGRLNFGCRCYLAVSGDWRVKQWLGSCSAFLQMPELTPNSILQPGHQLDVRGPRVLKRVLPDELINEPASAVDVRVVEGPEFSRMPIAARDHLLSAKHRVSNQCNRMGCRLIDALPGFRQDRELISAPVIPGTIQVTRDGHPIVLLADAQTTGGYYRVANVISADLDKLGQLKPNDTLSFGLVSREVAVAAMEQRQALIMQRLVD